MGDASNGRVSGLVLVGFFGRDSHYSTIVGYHDGVPGWVTMVRHHDWASRAPVPWGTVLGHLGGAP